MESNIATKVYVKLRGFPPSFLRKKENKTILWEQGLSLKEVILKLYPFLLSIKKKQIMFQGNFSKVVECSSSTGDYPKHPNLSVNSCHQINNCTNMLVLWLLQIIVQFPFILYYFACSSSAFCLQSSCSQHSYFFSCILSRLLVTLLAVDIARSLISNEATLLRPRRKRQLTLPGSAVSFSALLQFPSPVPIHQCRIPVPVPQFNQIHARKRTTKREHKQNMYCVRNYNNQRGHRSCQCPLVHSSVPVRRPAHS